MFLITLTLQFLISSHPIWASEKSELLARAETPARSLASTSTSSNPCEDESLTSRIPKSNSSITGREIGANLSNLNGADRDAKVLEEISCGSIPATERHLAPVKLGSITICVMPDYLSLGSDKDNVRFPMGLPASIQAAGQMGFMLPTTKMVDAIYQQAQTKLPASTRNPGPEMVRTTSIVAHDATIDQQLKDPENAGLIAGHKKDLVISNRLQSHPNNVAIYGWFNKNGSRIQPLSTVHEASYADYSHGIRMISQTAFVNGRSIPLKDLLADPQYASLLSDDNRPLSSSVLNRFKDTKPLPACSRADSGLSNGDGQDSPVSQ
jgi:hypothetical protein